MFTQYILFVYSILYDVKIKLQAFAEMIGREASFADRGFGKILSADLLTFPYCMRNVDSLEICTAGTTHFNLEQSRLRLV